MPVTMVQWHPVEFRFQETDLEAQVQAQARSQHQEEPGSKKQTRVSGAYLDGLRGIAMLGVFNYHLLGDGQSAEDNAATATGARTCVLDAPLLHGRHFGRLLLLHTYRLRDLPVTPQCFGQESTQAMQSQDSGRCTAKTSEIVPAGPHDSVHCCNTYAVAIQHFPGRTLAQARR